MTESNFNLIHQAVFQDKRNVYMSGIAGVGKSYQLKLLYQHAKEVNLNCELLSTTGVSAFNLNGKTIHSWSGVILPSYLLDTEEAQDRFLNKIIRKTRLSPYKERWRDVDIIFVDEISMLGAMYLETLDIVARNIRKNEMPFGGIQLVFTGDSLQCGPIKDEFFFESEVWYSLEFKNFILQKAYRFDNQDWCDLLFRARLGQLTSADIKTLKSRLKHNLSKDELEDASRILFVPLNKEVDIYNKDQLQRLSGREYKFEANDSVEVETKKLIKRVTLPSKKKQDEGTSIGHLTLEEKEIQEKEPKSKVTVIDPVKEEFDKIFMIEQVLVLKIGARVMLRVNLDIENGLVNGTVGEMVKVSKDYQIITVNFAGTEVEIEPFVFEDEEYEENKIVYRTRIQFPLCLAWATSIHKSQSLTFQKIEVDIGNSIFSPGQSYVALSRCKSLQGLTLTSFNPAKIYPDQRAVKFETSLKKIATLI